MGAMGSDNRSGGLGGSGREMDDKAESDSMIDRTVRIMRVFGPDETNLSLAEIASRAELPKSSVHRLIHTLVRQNLMTATGNGFYALGIGLWELGARVIGGSRMWMELNAIARRTADHFGETSHIGILDKSDVVYIVRAESRRAVSVRTYVGQRVPAHATATGKSLLAAMRSSNVSKDDMGNLAQFTESTITNIEDLNKELQEIRKQGYATNLGGWQTDLCGSASVIYGHDNQPIGTLGIAGPIYRFTREMLNKAGEELRELAGEASKSLGHMGFDAQLGAEISHQSVS